MNPGRVGQDVPWGDGDRGFARGVAAALGSPPVASGALTRSGEQRWAVESISGVTLEGIIEVLGHPEAGATGRAPLRFGRLITGWA